MSIILLIFNNEKAKRNMSNTNIIKYKYINKYYITIMNININIISNYKY